MPGLSFFEVRRLPLPAWGFGGNRTGNQRPVATSRVRILWQPPGNLTGRSSASRALGCLVLTGPPQPSTAQVFPRSWWPWSSWQRDFSWPGRTFPLRAKLKFS